MKMLAVHTVPVWEDPDGTRRPGVDAEDPHPRVVGWANVAVLELFGATRRLLLTREAAA